MNGEIEGDGRVGGELSVAAGARWHGDVDARRAVVAGTMEGNVRVEEKLELGATAVVRGRVSARTIAIARGAIVDGEMTVTGAEPVVWFEEKRAPRAAE